MLSVTQFIVKVRPMLKHRLRANVILAQDAFLEQLV